MPIKKGTLAVFLKEGLPEISRAVATTRINLLGEELRQEVPRKGKELNGTQITPD